MLFQLTFEKRKSSWAARFDLGMVSAIGRTRSEAAERVKRTLAAELNDRFGAEGIVELWQMDERFFLRTLSPTYVYAFLLRVNRESRGLSQREAAKLAGLHSHTSWQAYEAAERAPTLEQFCHYLLALDSALEPIVLSQAA